MQTDKIKNWIFYKKIGRFVFLLTVAIPTEFIISQFLPFTFSVMVLSSAVTALILVLLNKKLK